MPRALILTRREAEVLDAFCDLGETDLVARKLGVTERSIATYIARIMKKNMYPNRLMLVLAKDRENRQC
jgi:DNA-binding CsgD family transcriptional regulator